MFKSIFSSNGVASKIVGSTRFFAQHHHQGVHPTVRRRNQFTGLAIVACIFGVYWITISKLKKVFVEHKHFKKSSPNFIFHRMNSLKFCGRKKTGLTRMHLKRKSLSLMRPSDFMIHDRLFHLYKLTRFLVFISLFVHPPSIETILQHKHKQNKRNLFGKTSSDCFRLIDVVLTSENRAESRQTEQNKALYTLLLITIQSQETLSFTSPQHKSLLLSPFLLPISQKSDHRVTTSHHHSSVLVTTVLMSV